MGVILWSLDQHSPKPKNDFANRWSPRNQEKTPLLVALCKYCLPHKAQKVTNTGKLEGNFLFPILRFSFCDVKENKEACPSESEKGQEWGCYSNLASEAKGSNLNSHLKSFINSQTICAMTGPLLKTIQPGKRRQALSLPHKPSTKSVKSQI